MRKGIKSYAEKRQPMGGFSIESGIQDRFTNRCSELSLNRSDELQALMVNWLTEHDTKREYDECCKCIEEHHARLKALEEVMARNKRKAENEIITYIDARLSRYEENYKDSFEANFERARKFVGGLMTEIADNYEELHQIGLRDAREYIKNRIDPVLKEASIKMELKDMIKYLENLPSPPAAVATH